MMNIEEALQHTYLLGWQESAEGYNDEYPGEMEESDHWKMKRDEKINVIANNLHRSTNAESVELRNQLAAAQAQLEDVQRERDEMAMHNIRLKEALHQALVHWGYYYTPEDESAYRECGKRLDEQPATSIAAHDAALRAKHWREAANFADSEINEHGAFSDEIRGLIYGMAAAIERGES